MLRILAGVLTDFHGMSVEVSAQGLASAAPSFVDELIKEILVSRNASRLTVRAQHTTSQLS